MEKNILNLFNEHILQQAALRFQVNLDSLSLISDMENFVYKGESGKTPIILRITHASHRTAALLMGEFDWIGYLCANGVSVPHPIPSVNRKMIEAIEADQSQFLVTAFEKMEGKTIIDAGECTPELYRKWGRVLGRMHALAQHYEPREAACKRAEWFDNDLVRNVDQYVPGQVNFLEKYRRLTSHLQTLPKNRAAYGLIHSDFTDVNFFVRDHEIMVFDFDDCEYHWFVYDIAVILFDTLPWLPHHEMDKEGFARYFWAHFMDGYAQENTLEEYWLNQLACFLKLREMFLYAVFHKKWDLNHLQERPAKTLHEFKHNIENDVPYLDDDTLLFMAKKI